ncbi:MFS transporter [Candidatus Mycobacterium methanotrophicum]|uniref:MFS transporter n=1 Tax=Candidatus Mycobacterium methanotrophicum TaxID=2943498 RepID=A0ABY4QQY4_9MYCO|nr:MFS transporter [Candidatus Mycobacterium methanotrophicum]UQX13304.1 MFS transporter [Candidatus Mycobacterium methanotrophicum]
MDESAAGAGGPWTPRIAVQLAVLAAAAFIYVTAEILPVGALPAIARGLHVSVPVVGTLLAWYALVAAVTTIPLVRWTARWPRRRALLMSLACLTASQFISAVAPNFVVLAGGRVLSAITHGLMLSVIAPIATRLVPASHSGRATTMIYVGISLAVVVGSPATAAISLLWSWRAAVAAVAVVAAVVTVAAWAVLPLLALTEHQLARVGRGAGHHRNRRLVTVSSLTLVAVTGHYISYTFIAVIIRDVVGVRGPDLAWLLAAYGVAGLLAMPLVARPSDQRPRAAVISCMAGLWLTLLVLIALTFHSVPTAAGIAIGIAAVALWGATANAVSPMLQAAAMRAGADDPDGASGLYMAAFQIGIMAGSFAGGLLYEHGLLAMLAASAVLIGAGAAGMTAERHLFDVPSGGLR